MIDPAQLKSTNPGEANNLLAARECDVGLVFALGIESGAFEDRLANLVTLKGQGFVIRQGLLGGRRIAVLICGAGQAAARRGAEALIAGHHPDWVISAGFSGGLQPQLRRPDVVMADRVVGLAGESLTIDLRFDPRSLAAAPGVYVGSVLTVDRIIHQVAEKREFGARHRALAVDMESLAVAQVCSLEKQRFLAVRVISDALDEELPADLERLVSRATTAARLGAAAGLLMRRPGSIKDMWRLREAAIVSSVRLAKFLIGVIEQLVPIGEGRLPP